MPYIYKIKNNINDKVYIGKTMKTIEERFKQHCRESKRENREKRPLYNAMRKYGIENFSVEMVEECTPELLSEREKYWIEYYGSFKYGYNATNGGDGKPYLDYDLIIKLWNENKNIQEIAKIMKCDLGSVRKVLDINNISHRERIIRSKKNLYQSVAQLDKDTEEIINIFPSIQAAYNSLGKQHSGHIAAVCKGTRKTAYGFKWKYI